jgi:hypothetical protein
MDVEDEKTALEKLGIRIPDELVGLFIYVYDMVDKLWDEQRLKRASTGLMRGEIFNALIYFLTKIGADGRQRLTGGAEDLAFKYFSEKPREKQEVVALLARYGITPAVLQAKAAQQNSDAIQMFEAMTARRERSRRKLGKEDEAIRRRRESAKGSKKS